MGILIAALAVAAMAFAANLVGAASACPSRTSYCASSTEKNGIYKGNLYGPDGKPYPNARIRIHFESREDLPHVTFRTDPKGHVCIVWPREAIGPYTMTWFYSSLQVRHFGTDGFWPWQNLHGGEPPPGCQRSGATIPWYRAVDLHESRQYRVLFLGSLLAIVVLASALALWRRRRSHLLGVVGVVILLADLVAGAILWNL
jgi:hypothetical protein